MNCFVRNILSLWLSLFLALVTTPAAAQSSYMSDIDIYGTSNTTLEKPNVLIMLDNTANWSTMFEREIKAMVDAFNALPLNRFRVGLMMYTESGTGNSGNDGGYMRAAIRTLDSDYQLKLGALLNSLDKNADKSNGGKAALTMTEAYYYFAGQAPRSGHWKVKTDYTGNTSGTAASNAIYALPGNAISGISASPYSSPVTNSCAGNYIIFISNGPAQDNSSDNTAASNALSDAYRAAGMTRPADITGLTPNDSESNVADEWARFMKSSSRLITTYTLDVDPGTTRTHKGWSALLKSMALRSGGEYFAIDSTVNDGEQIRKALNNVFNQIMSVNSVFASASLPVSVNARGTYLNQVFMGMFRPDGNARPLWRGNLKQYQFGYDPVTDTLQLEDSLGNPAISGATGFLSPSAVSFWTQPSTFWSETPMGTPASASDSPDGEVVEKGGVAQGLRTNYATSQSDRKVYTCVACANGTNLAVDSTTQFVTGNSALATTLFENGTSVSSTERDQIIAWTRGANNTDPAELAPGGISVRPSIHGDVLHSRPAVVNYGGSNGVVVFYGSNDGLLRAVNGNQTGTGAGEEMWAFLPSEQIKKLKRLRDSDPKVRLSMTPMPTDDTPPPTPRDYFVDGPIGVYQKVSSTGAADKVHIYVGKRRGGRQFYALDVTDPRQPRMLWKKTEADHGGILGQTWSEPRVGRIKGNINPVIIMGAGYDEAAEDPLTPGPTTMGNAVLIFDAFTGTLLKKFDTARSVAADVSLVDADYDGKIDRAYAVDVGGNVYRIDFEVGTETAATAWRSFQLAALSDGTATRKVFFQPDVVFTGTTAAVLVGTGDREKPLTYTTKDAFYTIYDTVLTRSSTAPTEPLTPAELGQVGTDQDMTKGCFIALSTDGEKVVNAPVTVGGNTYFSTNTPNAPGSNSCTANLGVAKAYAAPLFCKAATSEVRIGGGMPPTAVSGIVTVTYTSPTTGLPVQKQVPFLIGGTAAADDPGGCSKNSGIEGCKVKLKVPATRSRKYWFMENAR